MLAKGISRLETYKHFFITIIRAEIAKKKQVEKQKDFITFIENETSSNAPFRTLNRNTSQCSTCRSFGSLLYSRCHGTPLKSHLPAVEITCPDLIMKPKHIHFETFFNYHLPFRKKSNSP